MKYKWLVSLSFAIEGLKTAVSSERNMRIHLRVALFVILAAVCFRIKLLEWALIIFAIGMVLVAELVNTAIERTIDLSHATYHPLAKAAKDIAAGAVLIAALTSVLIGIIVFGPYLLKYISSIL